MKASKDGPGNVDVAIDSEIEKEEIKTKEQNKERFKKIHKN